MDRRQFIKQFSLGALGLGSAASLDGLLIEPHRAVAEHVTVRFPRLPEAFHGFRIALMADIHFGPYVGKAQVERAVKLALPFSPDVVVLAGDFVLHPFLKHNGIAGARHAEPCAEVLKQLSGVRVVSILGNHDHWNGPGLITEILDSHGLGVLRNQSLPLEKDGHRIWIVGVDDVYEGANDLPKALRGIPANEFKVVAVHEPDFADETTHHSVDLQLSGHSHGGQVRIPGYGALILPPLAEKYPIGLRQAGNMQVYTNRGIGVIAPPVRFNCLPEVTLITLVGAETPSSV